MRDPDMTANDIETASLPYLLFTVGKNTYGLSSEFVKSIETLGKVTDIAGAESNVRGGVIYQNTFIELIDMRKLFGLALQLEEFEKTVQPEQRIKDHENWVSALERSVRDHTEFTLTDDPHQCAFGKWYYTFATDNNVLKHQIKAIEAPHAAVHATAKRIKKLLAENLHTEALAEIEKMKATHYKTTLHILSHLREIVESSLRELYIVIDTGDCLKGIIVDSIVGVDYLSHTIEMPETMRKIKYINFLGQQENDKTIVTVLNRSL